MTKTATDRDHPSEVAPKTRSVPSTALCILGLALAYFVTGWLGLLVASKPGNVTALWPPSGIALSVLLVWGRRAWPGVLIGSFLTNIFFFPAPEGGLRAFAGPLAIALGSTLEIVVASWFVERFASGRDALAMPSRVLRFALACLSAAAIAAGIGLVATATFGTLPPALEPRFFVTWWLGDAVGMLALGTLGMREDVRSKRAGFVEWAGVVLVTAVIGQLVFGRPLPQPMGTSFPVAWAVLPTAVWAGSRLGARGVAVQTLLVHVAASWATLIGRGPMANIPEGVAIMTTNGLLIATVLTGLLLSSSRAQAKRSRALLEKEHRSLEEKVVERTAKLAETNRLLTEEMSESARLGQKLVEAQKQEALGRLAGGVAHDFNNLLTVIVAEAGLVATGKMSAPDVKESALAILAASSRATELTRQLLTVARRQPGAPKLIDVNVALAETRRLLRPILRDDIELDVVACDPPRFVRIDPTQLGQVLLNLAINARDAMPAGGQLAIRPSLEVLEEPLSDAPQTTPGPWVRIDVCDSGEGIAPELLSRIFEPFFTTKPGGRGTGLGLSTAAGIVELAGGALVVRSALGGGSTFSLWLPSHERTGSLVPAPDTASVDKAHPAATILLAEDEPLVRRIVVASLERAGYRVLSACDGEEALSVARQHAMQFDLVVTDVVMPRMGGPDLVRKLREVGPMPVLFISGYHEREEELRGERLLAKPFSTDELIAAVLSALEDPRR